MNLIIKGLLAAFWLAAVPWASGALLAKKKQRLTAFERLILGYCLMFAFFEALTLPMIWLDANLDTLTLIFALVMAAGALAGLFRTFQEGKKKEGRAGEREAFFVSLPMAGALLAILLQIGVVMLYAHMDADDSFYVGTASTDVETSTIFSVNPYTGAPYTKRPSRYVLSPFPVFLAVTSRLCKGLHPAILAHTLYPAVFLALGYGALFLLGRRLFPKDGSRQWAFLFLCAVAIWFSGYSIYSSGNFQMVRIWQGKALLAGVFLPILLYLSMEILLEEEPAYPWPVLFLANGACCLLSSMGILLGTLLMGVTLLMSLARFRSLKRLLYGIACCLPSLILGAVYMVIR